MIWYPMSVSFFSICGKPPSPECQLCHSITRNFEFSKRQITRLAPHYYRFLQRLLISIFQPIRHISAKLFSCMNQSYRMNSKVLSENPLYRNLLLEGLAVGRCKRYPLPTRVIKGSLMPMSWNEPVVDRRLEQKIYN